MAREAKTYDVYFERSHGRYNSPYVVRGIVAMNKKEACEVVLGMFNRYEMIGGRYVQTGFYPFHRVAIEQGKPNSSVFHSGRTCWNGIIRVLDYDYRVIGNKVKEDILVEG